MRFVRLWKEGVGEESERQIEKSVLLKTLTHGYCRGNEMERNVCLGFEGMLWLSLHQ